LVFEVQILPYDVQSPRWLPCLGYRLLHLATTPKGTSSFELSQLDYKPRQFASVPNVGYYNYFLSWLSAFRYAAGAQAFLDEGYKRVSFSLPSCMRPSQLPQFKGGLFLVPQLETWVVAVSSPDYVEDMRRASTQELSGSALLAHVRPLLPQ